MGRGPDSGWAPASIRYVNVGRTVRPGSGRRLQQDPRCAVLEGRVDARTLSPPRWCYEVGRSCHFNTSGMPSLPR